MSNMDSIQKQPDIMSPPSLKQLREAIPPHCHRSSASVSLGYIFRDVAICGLLAFMALRIADLHSAPLQCLCWTLYGIFQGFVFTGIWILAHECGHQALFNSRLTNDSIGWILHSMLLVPYFSWKFSHAQHHRYTNHMDKDTAFVPSSTPKNGIIDRLSKMYDLGEDAPLTTILVLAGHQLLGWPMYLFSHITAGHQSLRQFGRKGILFSNHFNPWSGFFSPAQRWHILASDIGIAAMLLLLREAVHHLGGRMVLLLYGVPYLWVNHWIVTYLHHTHPEANHYGDSAWTFTNGALSTVDRDFGFIGREMFHGIIEYHVIHHLFPKIPFYHAEEATGAIEPLLGERYLRDNTPFLETLWKSFRKFRYVEPKVQGSNVFTWAQPNPRCSDTKNAGLSPR